VGEFGGAVRRYRAAGVHVGVDQRCDPERGLQCDVEAEPDLRQPAHVGPEAGQRDDLVERSGIRTVVPNERQVLAVEPDLFSALGYLLIAVIPNTVISGFVGGDSPFSVPITALLGIPVYITTDGSLPLVASMMDAGMGNGAAMAFLITGAGTSIGAIAGSLIIARWRLVGLVVGILLVGGVLLGFGTQLAFD
jgi:hypothetical protein